MDEITVFFDGKCGLCDRFVSFLLASPGAESFRFSPLQGTTFAEILKSHPEFSEVDSIIVRHQSGGRERFLTHSEGALFLLSRLDGPVHLLGHFRKLPRFLRDTGYRFIAQIRYRIFGKRNECRLPSEAERERFLP